MGSLQRPAAKALFKSRLNVNVKGLSMLIGPSIFNVPGTALIALTACWEPRHIYANQSTTRAHAVITPWLRKAR